MLIFDIETNGFLDVLDTIHVINIFDTETSEYTSYDLDRTPDAVAILDGQHICGHNIIGFDVPAILKLYPDFNPSKITDTLVLGRLAWADIKQADLQRYAKGTLDGKLIGSHALKAYGQRLGILKGDFGETTDWGVWSQDMSDYCKQDVEVTVALWDKLAPKIASGELSEQAMELEHQVQTIIVRQMAFGFEFDIAKAHDLYAELVTVREELMLKVINSVPPWLAKHGKEVDPKKTMKRKTKKTLNIPLYANRDPKLAEDEILSYTTVGYPYQPLKVVVFNPTSRDHIARLFSTKYGWVPQDFTKSGKPKIDETVLSNLTYPEARPLADLFLIVKRIAQLAEGKQAWLQTVDDDGRMHGYVNSNGAVTGRMTHSNPNVAQVPSVKQGKDGKPLVGFVGGYGVESRTLFKVPKGYKLVGCDASGLELRCLAHYMARYDKGEYADVILNGDIHTVNQEAAGLPTRSNAKTFIYGFLYGAGDEKIGSIVGKGRQAGAFLKKTFLRKLPALKYLLEAVQEKSISQGYLIGLDGRRLSVRSSHAALNTLLQSAGALVMKQYLVFLDKNLEESGVDYEFVANIHDEVQIQVLEEHATRVAQIAEDTFAEVTKHFGFRCRLDGEAKVGKNWMETH